MKSNSALGYLPVNRMANQASIHTITATTQSTAAEGPVAGSQEDLVLNVGDRVFYDNDANGIQNGGETGVAAVAVDLFNEFSGRGLIWGLHRASLAEVFDHTLVLEGGRVVEQGRFSELDKPGNVLNQLVAAG